MLSYSSRYLLKIFYFLLPVRCPECGLLSDNFSVNPFCLRCWNKLRNIPPKRRCLGCGRPVEEAHGRRCINCLKSQQFLDGVFVYGEYEGVLKRVIHVIKFDAVRRLAKKLGDLLTHPEIPPVDCIVPVPLSRERLLKRGFNQSLWIGRGLSEKQGIPLNNYLLIKTRETTPQSLLSGKERLRNPRGAFAVVKEKDIPERVLLIDDVITTGATLNECAKVLKSSGVKYVYALVAARST
jgi:ComF family protein